MISTDDIEKTFSALAATDAPSLHERRMADQLKELFAGLGIALSEDGSAAQTGSDAGNLYGYVKGNGSAPLLLSSHMDTVMPGVGKKAVFHPDGKITSDGTTVLGADDISGITAIYEALRYITENGMEHRGAELLFTTGEELYCKGAKAFDFKKIKSKDALVLDLDGRIGTAAYAAPTILSLTATVLGKAAHAGFCPEDGVHAVLAACEAVAALPQGRIDDGTTANIGMITGGDGVNIVPAHCVVKGEIRSLSHEKAAAAAERYREIFSACAEKYGARLEWTMRTDLYAYETEKSGGLAAAYERACRGAGIEPEFIKTFGGSDNNVFAKNGIAGLVAANSMHNAHSCAEYADVSEIAKISEIVVRMLTQA